MELKEIGTSKNLGVTMFAPEKKKGQRTYSGLREMIEDIVRGIERISNKEDRPSIILINGGDKFSQEYFKGALKRRGYYTLILNEPVPERHPGRNVYFIDAEYFLDRLNPTTNPRAL